MFLRRLNIRRARDAFQGGFGAHSVLHTSHLLELSTDLPIVIEVVDTEEHMEKLMPILEEMVAEGLVTMEKVRVLKYAAGPKK